MSEELKPCPFCGGGASETDFCGNGTAYAISCEDPLCPAGPIVNEATKELALAHWNTRTHATKDATIARLRAALERIDDDDGFTMDAWQALADMREIARAEMEASK